MRNARARMTWRLAGACKRIQIAMATAVGRHMRITPNRAKPKIGDVQRGPTTHIHTDTHIGACVRPAAGATESTSIMHSPRTRYQGASSRRRRCRCRPIRCRVAVGAAAATAVAVRLLATVAAAVTDARVPGTQRCAALATAGLFDTDANH